MFYRLWVNVLFVSCVQCLHATDYYVDAETGDDLNDGVSESTPWKSLEKVNQQTFQPGDNIFFKTDQQWFGTLKLQGSGEEGSPITLGSYGSGSRPQINGMGITDCSAEGTLNHCTIYLFNQEYWIIRDLEITNYNSEEEEGLTLEAWEANNVSSYVNVDVPLPFEEERSLKTGILVEVTNIGEVNSLSFINLEIHGINGDMAEKDNGGIFLEVLRSSSQRTYFNGLLFEDCHIHDVDRTGISNRSVFDTRGLATNTDWTPSLNYVMRNCTFERTGANALIVRTTEGALIDNCLFSSCSIKGSGNAAFNFNTDNTTWQFNEARFTKANDDDEDAGGIDSDYRSKNTIIQYNYLHDNDFGMLVTGGPGSNNFNDVTIVRYNIFERDGKVARKGFDGKFVLRTSGNCTNVVYHNNVIYVDEDQDNTKLVFHKEWSEGIPDGVSYYNNIFYNPGSRNSFFEGSSINTSYSNNIYFGNGFANFPDDPVSIKEDPLFTTAPGTGMDAYKIQEGSSAIARGIALSSIPGFDFYGNEIPEEVVIDIGVNQVSTQRIITGLVSGRRHVRLFPNPSQDFIHVSADVPLSAVRIISLNGQELSRISLSTPTAQMEISNLPAGQYLVEVLYPDGLEMFKLIKK